MNGSTRTSLSLDLSLPPIPTSTYIISWQLVERMHGLPGQSYLHLKHHQLPTTFQWRLENEGDGLSRDPKPSDGYIKVVGRV